MLHFMRVSVMAEAYPPDMPKEVIKVRISYDLVLKARTIPTQRLEDVISLPLNNV
jgi:hypothetical protein